MTQFYFLISRKLILVNSSLRKIRMKKWSLGNEAACPKAPSPRRPPLSSLQSGLVPTPVLNQSLARSTSSVIGLEWLFTDNGCWGVNLRWPILFIDDRTVQWQWPEKGAVSHYGSDGLHWLQQCPSPDICSQCSEMITNEWGAGSQGDLAPYGASLAPLCPFWQPSLVSSWLLAMSKFFLIQP